MRSRLALLAASLFSRSTRVAAREQVEARARDADGQIASSNLRDERVSRVRRLRRLPLGSASPGEEHATCRAPNQPSLSVC